MRPVPVAGAHPVGREDELEALAGFLDPDSLPRAAVLAGEAGIGKTTVWLAAGEAAVRRGFRVLASRPSESETAFSFATLGDLVGGALPELLPELPPPQRRALSAALAVADADGGPVEERVVSFAFLSALRALAAREPIVVAVDDVHWLDGASLAALRFALVRPERDRVGALLTTRGEVPAWLRRAWPEERVLTVELGPLSIGALHELLRDRLGSTLPRPALRRIWETSGGNPFFALELARALDRAADVSLPARNSPSPPTSKRSCMSVSTG